MGRRRSRGATSVAWCSLARTSAGPCTSRWHAGANDVQEAAAAAAAGAARRLRWCHCRTAHEFNFDDIKHVSSRVWPTLLVALAPAMGVGFRPADYGLAGQDALLGPPGSLPCTTATITLGYQSPPHLDHQDSKWETAGSVICWLRHGAYVLRM